MTLVQQQPTSIKIRTTNIKKVMMRPGNVETQVRPSGIWSFSYDFTTGSVADLQSKGWTVPSGNEINSYGYWNSNRNWSFLTYSGADLNTAIQNAKQVKLSYTWNYEGGICQRSFGFLTGNKESGFYGDGVSPVGGNQASLAGEQLFTEAGSVYGTAGTYTNHLTIDLENKTRKYEGTDHSTLTGSITDTAISNFRVGGQARMYGESTAYMQSMSIIIY